MSKGSRKRPSRVPDREVEENWRRTFGEFTERLIGDNRGDVVSWYCREDHLHWWLSNSMMHGRMRTVTTERFTPDGISLKVVDE